MAGMPSAPLHQARAKVPHNVLSGTASRASSAYARSSQHRCLAFCGPTLLAHTLLRFAPVSEIK